MGGTNAHVIVEEAPAQSASGPSRPSQLVVLSARTRGALDEATARLADHLSRHPGVSFPDVASTLQLGRRAFPHRRIVVCGGAADAAFALRHPDRPPVVSATTDAADRSCVFLFSGQGSQYPGMARGLYRDEASFRADVDECCAALAPHLGRDLRQLLHAEDGSADAALLKETQFTQPALFVIEYALARLWTAWGIRPAAMLGHSVGEYVAACLAGVFSLEDALALVAARGRLMQALPAGAMLAVPLAEAELTPLLGSSLSLAAVNGPALCVASGPAAAIDELEARLAARKVSARRLETSHAFHSAMMDPVLAEFAGVVAGVERRAPRIPFISNVTGTWITAGEATDPAYWTQHLRQAVRFAEGAQELLKDTSRVFIEVGPGRTLASLVRQQGAAAQGRTVLTSLRHPQETSDDLPFVLQSLGRLWLAGVAVDWRGFASGENRRRVPLPTYPFERQRFWIDLRRPDAAHVAVAAAPRALAKNADMAAWFYAPSWTRAAVGRPRPIESTTWLVFARPDALSGALVDGLRNAGASVVSAREGERFVELGPDDYALNPARPADYDALMNALAASGRLPARIVHLWSLGAVAAPDGADAFAWAQDRGFYSVLFLAQALGRLGRREPLELAIVGDELRQVEAADLVAPEKSPLLGLCLVIPQEYPHVSCTTIDVSRGTATAPEPLADLLLAELRAEPAATVAYRGAQRWVQAPEAIAVAAAAGDGGLREHGVYLITGGLGNIGLAIAERLARDARARLVLVGRSTPPPPEAWPAWIESHPADDRVTRQITALRVLEALGSDVLVVGADVSSLDDMRAVVARTVDRFGGLHGVIHAAGTLRGGVDAIQSLTRDACDLQFRPKVAGLYALEEATADLALDFCLLTSSLSALLGGLGYGAYAAANQFLDSFAEQRIASGGRRWISVNLDGWAFERAAAVTAVGALEMLPAEGVESLARVLGDPSLTRVAVSTGDLPARLDRYVRNVHRPPAAVETPAAAASATSRYARPDISTEFAAPVDEIERTIAAVWQELLGITQIGRDDNFFDLGGHSMLLIQAHDTLVEKLGRPIAVTDLFQFSTIATLAAHLGGARREAPVVRVAERAAGATPNAVAIIGMAGRFPGAPDLEAFWTNLRNGVESIEPISDDELRDSGVDEALLRNPRYVKASSTIDNVAMFDAGFFGYSPREAELIDPQHRLFLECAWEALEQAGYDSKQYDGQIGVYAGANFNGYLLRVLSNRDAMQVMGSLQAGIGNRGDHLPTRVSYKLSLRGPSLNVQTACSTSLVAVHQACRSLVDGECDMALAGGASISVGIDGKTGYLSQEEGILSPDGHCRAFDAQAQGTIWGDGVGIVVLKRLADAIADGDTIHAVIRGTAINNDGSAKVGYTAPSVDGQTAVVARALAVAGVAPAEISYVEAHGTGTTLGDPIEVAALSQAFGPLPADTCAIGTLKTNVGHLDAAAGVAGLIKTALALEHRELPPSLHFTTPNPKIDFAGSPFFVNARLRPWVGHGAPRRAGVSAFGIGGTNAHAVVEEAPAPTGGSASRAVQLLVLSARSRAALDAATARLSGYLAEHPELPLADVAYTLRVGRRAFPHRRMVVCSDGAAAVRSLSQPDRPPVFSAVAEPADKPCVFMFSGQGAQYVGMARDLYREEPSFRADVDACCEQLTRHLGVDLRTALYPANDDDAGARARLTETRLAQPALFVIEYATARLLMTWGIRPAALIGHSVGEYVAACLAGVFSLEDALALVAARGRLMQALPPGAMLAVPLSEADVTPLLGAEVSLAAVNGPALCVASGPVEAIAALETHLAARGVTARRLETSHAFHSAMMDPVLEPFAAVVAKTDRRAPQIPFISNVTGTWITAAEATDPAYWVRHLRQAVRFDDGARELLKDANRVFVEVGPGRTLASLVRQQGALAQGRAILTSLRHPQETQADVPFAVQTLGRLWLAGVAVDWRGFHAAETRRRIPLPTYPFERQRYWIEDAPQVRAPRALVKRADLAEWFYAPSWTRAAIGPARASTENRAWLVFAGDEPLADAVVERLKAGGTVVAVRAGERFDGRGPDTYTVNPQAPGDYDSLLEALARSGRLPGRVVHLWSLGSSSAKEAAADRFALAQDRGFYSVLFLVQALARRGLRDALELTVIGDELREIERGDTVAPEKSPLLGLCLVIPQEYPHISCVTVDVERTPVNGASALAELILAELNAEPGAATIAYRGSRRWRQQWEPTTVTGSNEIPALRESGVYLITGGLGNVGCAIAERLAREVRARLVLVGRSTPPPREAWNSWLETHAADDPTSLQIAKVQSLEALGAEVLVAAAEVSNVDEVRAVVARTTRQFGALHGVIHAAGTMRTGFDALASLDTGSVRIAVPAEGWRPLRARPCHRRSRFARLLSADVVAVGAPRRPGLRRVCRREPVPR